jgi:delta 1-pyrroline-5-carboxylate dehydrogenase
LLPFVALWIVDHPKKPQSSLSRSTKRLVIHRTILNFIIIMLEEVFSLPMYMQLALLLSATHFLHSFGKPILKFLTFAVEFQFTKVPSIQVDLPPQLTKEAASTDLKPKQVSKINLMDCTQPDKVQCYDPSTLLHLGTVPKMTPAQVSKACQDAKVAQVSWSQTSYAQRRLVLRTIQQYITTHQEEICTVSAIDSGKPPVDALLGEVMTTCEKIRCINFNGEEWLQKSYRPVGPMMMHKTAYVEYIPYGVLGVIAPWNYPFHNMLNHVISGLFSGNAVVTKVSEHTSWSALYFTNLVRMALEVNGHDTNVVQTIYGFGDAGAALVQCEFVDKIIFTGSPTVGKLVMEGCSKVLKPVVLELGGKDPMVFCDDVNINVSFDQTIIIFKVHRSCAVKKTPHSIPYN